MTQPAKYPSLSESEGFAHIESYLQSGLCPSEYYHSRNLSENQFYYWRKRYRSVHPELFDTKTKSSGEGKRFHELKFDKESVELELLVSLSGGIEIHYPHGVKVVIPVGIGWEVDKLSSLIKVYV
jgi:hypothetical protein